MTEANAKLEKDNTQLNDKNDKLDSEIKDLLQRIQVNTLLKEIDMQELEIIAKNTEELNLNLGSTLNRWEKAL